MNFNEAFTHDYKLDNGNVAKFIARPVSTTVFDFNLNSFIGPDNINLQNISMITSVSRKQAYYDSRAEKNYVNDGESINNGLGDLSLLKYGVDFIQRCIDAGKSDGIIISGTDFQRTYLYYRTLLRAGIDVHICAKDFGWEDFIHKENLYMLTTNLHTYLTDKTSEGSTNLQLIIPVKKLKQLAGYAKPIFLYGDKDIAEFEKDHATNFIFNKIKNCPAFVKLDNNVESVYYFCRGYSITTASDIYAIYSSHTTIMDNLTLPLQNELVRKTGSFNTLELIKFCNENNIKFSDSSWDDNSSEFLKEERAADIAVFNDKFGDGSYDKFNKLKGRLKNNGISVDIVYHIKNTSVNDMNKLLYDTKNRVVKDNSGKTKLNRIKVSENDHYIAWDVLDWQTAMNMGDGTGWCIAGRYQTDGEVELSQAKQYFNQYKDQGIEHFIYLIPKHNEEKYCVCLTKVDDKFEFWNAADESAGIGLIPADKTLVGLDLYGLIISEDDIKDVIIKDNILVKYRSQAIKYVIPDSVTSIGDSAFYNCNLLTIRCHNGSYAEIYAKENDIPVKLIESITYKDEQLNAGPLMMLEGNDTALTNNNLIDKLDTFQYTWADIYDFPKTKEAFRKVVDKLNFPVTCYVLYQVYNYERNHINLYEKRTFNNADEVMDIVFNDAFKTKFDLIPPPRPGTYVIGLSNYVYSMHDFGSGKLSQAEHDALLKRYVIDMREAYKGKIEVLRKMFHFDEIEARDENNTPAEDKPNNKVVLTFNSVDDLMKGLDLNND